jgi:hypothetical protein
MQKNPKVRRHAQTVTFQETERLIHSTIHRFRRGHGGDYDELTGEAYLRFCEAYHRHDPGRGTFESYLAFYVYKQLLENARTIARHRAKLKQLPTKSLEPLSIPSRFNLQRFLAEISPDARHLVELVLNSTKSTNAGKIKQAILSLRGEGWSQSRIKAVFNEVQTALEDE